MQCPISTATPPPAVLLRVNPSRLPPSHNAILMRPGKDAYRRGPSLPDQVHQYCEHHAECEQADGEPCALDCLLAFRSHHEPTAKPEAANADTPPRMPPTIELFTTTEMAKTSPAPAMMVRTRRRMTCKGAVMLTSGVDASSHSSCHGDGAHGDHQPGCRWAAAVRQRSVVSLPHG